MEKEQPNDVTQKTKRADNGDNHSIADLWRADKSSNRFQTDRHAKGQEEDTIDKRTKNLGSLPSVRVGGRRGGCGEFDSVECDDEGQDVANCQL